MTQQEKQLLLKDLCARLPYGLKYCRDSWNYEWDQEMSVVETLEDIDKDGYINDTKVYKVWDIKPYLRPMSTMTEEERKELAVITTFTVWTPKVYEWYLEHHFDIHKLIEKGLAIEAKDGMYKM